MRLLLIAGLGLSLCACNTTIQSKVLDNIEHCDRHYGIGAGAGGLGAPNLTVTGNIDCKARPWELPVPPAE